MKWEEGELTPEGWEDMDLQEKVVQGLWGERGFLYWLNYLSYRLIFVLIGKESIQNTHKLTHTLSLARTLPRPSLTCNAARSLAGRMRVAASFRHPTGGWIVFRFVGPALNLYQLTNPFDINEIPL